MDQPTTPTSTPTPAPSPSTGIDSIAADRREMILRYANALIKAKSAGVAGDAVGHMQRFIDHVVRQRVNDAHDDERWAARLREMADDEQSWQRRIADRYARDLKRQAAPQAHGTAAVRLLRRADDLTPQQRHRLDERFDQVMELDVARAEALLPEIPRAFMASLQWRSSELLGSVPSIQAFRRLAQAHPRAVQAAGLAAFAGPGIPLEVAAVLLGPWAEVVDDDPSVLEDAWTDAADDIRMDIVSLDPSAFKDAIDDF